MSGERLVDITVVMAREFAEMDRLDPDSVRVRRREAGLRLLDNGFTRDQVEKLFGDVLGDEDVPAPPGP